ncbi:Domain of uncharacterised function (DUF2825) [Escherichia coli]|nr:Domain of uncharacterised function (DUF2825) [Escherichia coli]
MRITGTAAVYPRWRGEHFLGNDVICSSHGLSPLARGTHPEINGDGAFTRFIPAGAGNTSNCCNGQRSHAVYPRWRGEHCLGGGSAQPRNGLSPLARGTLVLLASRRAPVRFIPAGAGNTHSLARLNQLSPVYPRWRGEHSEYFADLFTDRGLSPLARGTRGNSFLDAALLRFIPAGAGNTLPSLVDEKSITVYPRWRGEHGGRIFYIPTVRGLSPLARGTLDRKYAPIDEKRFIPAGAGNTD